MESIAQEFLLIWKAMHRKLRNRRFCTGDFADYVRRGGDPNLNVHICMTCVNRRGEGNQLRAFNFWWEGGATWQGPLGTGKTQTQLHLLDIHRQQKGRA